MGPGWGARQGSGLAGGRCGRAAGLGGRQSGAGGTRRASKCSRLYLGGPAPGRSQAQGTHNHTPPRPSALTWVVRGRHSALLRLRRSRAPPSPSRSCAGCSAWSASARSWPPAAGRGRAEGAISAIQRRRHQVPAALLLLLLLLLCSTHQYSRLHPASFYPYPPRRPPAVPGASAAPLPGNSPAPQAESRRRGRRGAASAPPPPAGRAGTLRATGRGGLRVGWDEGGSRAQRLWARPNTAGRRAAPPPVAWATSRPHQAKRPAALPRPRFSDGH